MLDEDSPSQQLFFGAQPLMGGMKTKGLLDSELSAEARQAFHTLHKVPIR